MPSSNPFSSVAPTRKDAKHMLAKALELCATRRPITDAEAVRDVLSSFASRSSTDGSDCYIFDDGLSLNICYLALTGKYAMPPIPDSVESPIATILVDRLAIAFPLSLGKLRFASLDVLGEEDLRPDFFASHPK